MHYPKLRVKRASFALPAIGVGLGGLSGGLLGAVTTPTDTGNADEIKSNRRFRAVLGALLGGAAGGTATHFLHKDGLDSVARNYSFIAEQEATARNADLQKWLTQLTDSVRSDHTIDAKDPKVIEAMKGLIANTAR